MAGELYDNRGRGTAGWSWPTVHPEGRRFAAIALGVALFALLILDWDTIGWLLVLLAIAIAAFFRDPERVVPQDDEAILSPADGLVSQIVEIDPPPELQVDDGTGVAGLPPGRTLRVSIFMSLFDVHVNRAPVGGTVRRVVYVPGKFINAERDKASEDNERQHLLIERRDRLRIGFTQIAGMVSRRIVPFVKPGDTLAAGQRVGLIRFGSRVDLYLPPDTDPRVLPGQRVVAGETVIARPGQRRQLEGIAL